MSNQSAVPYQGMSTVTRTDVWYNGIQFTDIVRSSVRMKPVYNNNNTSIKYVDYTIEVEALLGPGSFESGGDTQNISELLQIRLLTDRAPLIYTERGLGGDFRITDIERDTGFGPKPRLLTFEPVAGWGQSQIVRVVWTCDVRTVSKCDRRFKKGVAEFWYVGDWEVDEQGYFKNTFKGYIELIPEHDIKFLGQNGRNKPMIFDRSQQRFIKEIYRIMGIGTDTSLSVTSQRYNVTNDGKGCNFTITKEEKKGVNPYPIGVVNIRAEHSAESDLVTTNPYKKGFKNWLNSMSVDITLKRDAPKTLAWVIFTKIAGDRLARGIGEISEKKNDQGEVIRHRTSPLLLSLKIREDIYDDTVSFTITWYIRLAEIYKLFERTGLFQRVDVGNSRQEWANDVKTVQGPWGPNQNAVYYNHNSQAIIDPCNQGSFNQGSEISGENTLIPNLQVFTPRCPEPSESWLEYQNNIKVEVNEAKESWQRFRPFMDISRNRTDTNPNLQNQQVTIATDYNTKITESDHYIQDFGNDDFKVRMTGAAIRFGAPTQHPVIKSIAGKKAEIISDESTYETRVHDSNANCPIHISKWDLVYRILGSPTDRDIPSSNDSDGSPGEYPA